MSDNDADPVAAKDHPDYERPDEWVDTLQVIEVNKLAKAISASTMAQGLDWYMTQDIGLNPKDWAYITDRSKQTVDRNISNMEDVVSDDGYLPTPDNYSNIFDPVSFAVDGPSHDKDEGDE